MAGRVDVSLSTVARAARKGARGRQLLSDGDVWEIMIDAPDQTFAQP